MESLIEQIDEAIKEKVQKEWEVAHWGSITKARQEYMIQMEYDRIINMLVWEK